MSLADNIREKIKLKKEEIKRQEDYIFQQECGNDFYCLSGGWERDHRDLANLNRDLRELRQELDRNDKN